MTYRRNRNRWLLATAHVMLPIALSSCVADRCTPYDVDVDVVVVCVGQVYTQRHVKEQAEYESALQRMGFDPKLVAAEIKAYTNKSSVKPPPGAGGEGAGGAGGGVTDAEVALPLARVKRVMQLDSDVKHVNKEANALVAKATVSAFHICLHPSVGSAAV
jgi:hypothetical protein